MTAKKSEKSLPQETAKAEEIYATQTSEKPLATYDEKTFLFLMKSGTVSGQK
ncbi:MAG TPA: hypothetical protein VKW70_06180 [Terriglobia bacterium]|nr:hypothetical protein [Terriglobia bacterium]